MGTHPIFESDFDCLTENARSTTATTTSAIGRPATGATLGTAANASWHGRNGRSGTNCTRRVRVKGEWHFGFVESGTRKLSKRLHQTLRRLKSQTHLSQSQCTQI